MDCSRQNWPLSAPAAIPLHGEPHPGADPFTCQKQGAMEERLQSVKLPDNYRDAKLREALSLGMPARCLHRCFRRRRHAHIEHIVNETGMGSKAVKDIEAQETIGGALPDEQATHVRALAARASYQRLTSLMRHSPAKSSVEPLRARRRRTSKH